MLQLAYAVDSFSHRIRGTLETAPTTLYLLPLPRLRLLMRAEFIPTWTLHGRTFY